MDQVIPFDAPRLVTWRTGANVVSQAGDTCRKQSWIFFKYKVCYLYYTFLLTKHFVKGDTEVGRIAEIITSAGTSFDSGLGLITVDVFSVADTRHPDFDLPYLLPLESEQEAAVCYRVIQSTVSGSLLLLILN